MSLVSAVKLLCRRLGPTSKPMEKRTTTVKFTRHAWFELQTQLDSLGLGLHQANSLAYRRFLFRKLPPRIQQENAQSGCAKSPMELHQCHLAPFSIDNELLLSSPDTFMMVVYVMSTFILNEIVASFIVNYPIGASPIIMMCL